MEEEKLGMEDGGDGERRAGMEKEGLGWRRRGWRWRKEAGDGGGDVGVGEREAGDGEEVVGAGEGTVLLAFELRGEARWNRHLTLSAIRYNSFSPSPKSASHMGLHPRNAPALRHHTAPSKG